MTWSLFTLHSQLQSGPDLLGQDHHPGLRDEVWWYILRGCNFIFILLLQWCSLLIPLLVGKFRELIIPYSYSFSFSMPILVCRKRVDLAFLIDGSGSIESSGRGNFQRCIRFVKTVVSSFSIAPQRTRVGVVLFSSRSWLILDFYRSTNKARVLHTISRIRYPRGGTRIGKALNFVLYRLFRRSRRAMKV